MRAACKKCNDPHITPWGDPSCVGHKKSTGKACRANPVRGATVCSKHGGQVGAVRRKAAERVAEEKITRTMGDLLRAHDIPDQHPFAALLEVSRRMGAMTRTLEQLVTEYRTAGEDDRLHAALNMYERFGRLSAQVSKTALDANLDERLMKIEEAKLDAVFTAVAAAMRRADLTPTQADAFRKALADELRGYRAPAAPAIEA